MQSMQNMDFMIVNIVTRRISTTAVTRNMTLWPLHVAILVQAMY